ncbi:MAG: hypothetical protein ABSE08_02450 [Syntrophobacteraceae bacterium]|jgi:hypothetical protein
MKLESLTGTSLAAMGPRFNLVNMVPAVVLLLVIMALVWSGAPGKRPDVDRIVQSIRTLELSEGVFLTLALMSLSLVIHPLQLSMVRLLEGYWGSSRLGSLLFRFGVKFHGQRRDNLEKAQSQEGPDDPSASIAAQISRAALELRRSYPDQDLLPTALGNVLRAAEDLPGTRYGLDATVIWPRLYPLLPKELTAILADQRNQLDLAVRFCFVFLLAVPISAFFLWRYDWWLLIPAACAAMAWVSYRSAISAALGYGDGINTAFDLYRFKLYEVLHLPLPDDRDTEKEANLQLAKFWLQGVPANFQYVHHKGKKGGKQEINSHAVHEPLSKPLRKTGRGVQ